jgi:hypothetical protein
MQEPSRFPLHCHKVCLWNCRYLRQFPPKKSRQVFTQVELIAFTKVNKVYLRQAQYKADSLFIGFHSTRK